MVCISGSAQHMPQDVIGAFEDVVAQQGGMSQLDAQLFMKQLQNSGRCVVEAWS